MSSMVNDFSIYQQRKERFLLNMFGDPVTNKKKYERNIFMEHDSL